MPYFYRNEGGDKDINVLFVHIPKTGGTSFENYMSKRYDIPLNNKSLYKKKKGEKSTYQHFTLQNIWKRREEFGIHEDGLRIIAFVRNPYDRTISDLFFWKLIEQEMSPDKVSEILRRYLNGSHNYDNHKLPQAKFVLDSSGNIRKDVKIIHLEKLKEGLSEIGFDDFNTWDFANPMTTKQGESMDYSKYLNRDSMRMINDYYAQDFVLFGYDKIDPSNAEGFTIYSTNDSEHSILLWISIVGIILLYIFIQRFRRPYRG